MQFNSLPDPDPFWLQRWRSLSNSIFATRSSMRAKLQQLTPSDDLAKILKKFETILDELLDFGRGQFFYFCFGFSHNLLAELDKIDFSESPDFSNLKVDNIIEEWIYKYKDALEETEYLYISENNEACERKRPQRLVKDYDYPPSYVLRTILDQISFDLEVIQRAIFQRFPTVVNTDTENDPASREFFNKEDQQHTLDLATQWSEMLLEKATNDLKLFPKIPKVISFFNRSPMVRMIPYDNVALVGIPMTTTLLGHRRDLLVIGHELGHYTYWHGQANNKSIREKLQDIVRGESPYIRNWIEEIFADVFSIVISGELAMLPWSLEMIADNTPNVYVRDNKIHPIDAVRPYIYIETIKLLNAKKWTVENNDLNKQEDDEIDDSLLKIIEKIEAMRKLAGGYEHFLTLNRFGQTVTIELDEVKDQLKEIVPKIVNMILNFPNYPIGITQYIKGLEERLCQLNWLKQFDNLHQSIKLLKKINSEPFSIHPQTLLILRALIRKQDLDSYALYDETETRFRGWYDEFESTLPKRLCQKSEPRCEDIDDDAQVGDVKSEQADKKNKERSFLTIRETYFEISLEVNIWKIVFAADGWTVKGPETRPTGDLEANWGRSDFHL